MIISFGFYSRRLKYKFFEMFFICSRVAIANNFFFFIDINAPLLVSPSLISSGTNLLRTEEDNYYLGFRSEWNF